jgi:hypothetical protein
MARGQNTVTGCKGMSWGLEVGGCGNHLFQVLNLYLFSPGLKLSLNSNSGPLIGSGLVQSGVAGLLDDVMYQVPVPWNSVECFLHMGLYDEILENEPESHVTDHVID